MEDKLKKIWLTVITGTVGMIVVAWCFPTRISDDVVSGRTWFYTQSLITLCTIVVVPLALWYVQPSRYVGSERGRYERDCVCRLFLLEATAVVNCLAYVMSSQTSFFYLAIITLIAMFFARGKNTDVDGN